MTEKFNTFLFHNLAKVDEPFYTPLNKLVNAIALMRKPEKVVHLGEANPDKTFYVIDDLSPSVGLAGWMDLVAGYMLRAEKKGWVPVIKSSPPAQKDSGDWYSYFKPVSEYSLEDILQSKNVVYATRQAMIFKRYSKKNISERNRIYKKFELSESAKRFVAERINAVFAGMPSPIVGVRFRGTDYRVGASWRPTGHATVPRFEYFCERVIADMNKWGVPIGKGEHIYLVTEEQEALDAIRARFSKCRYINKERFANFEFDKCLCYKRLPTLTPYENNLYYLLEMITLSKCDYLVGGYNGAVIAACNLNGGNYKAIDIMKTGVS